MEPEGGFHPDEVEESKNLNEDTQTNGPTQDGGATEEENTASL